MTIQGSTSVNTEQMLEKKAVVKVEDKHMKMQNILSMPLKWDLCKWEKKLTDEEHLTCW